MKYSYIDALRGIAVIGVLMVHCTAFGRHEPFTNNISFIFAHGSMGVQLFFIASAFTLFLSFSKRSEIEKYPKFNFFIRRFFRIAPMFYIGIGYYIWQFTSYSGQDENYISFWNIISHILFFHGFNQFWINSIVPGGWSIAVEMLFYTTVPFLFMKIKNSQQAFILIIIALSIRIVFRVFLFVFHIVGSDLVGSRFLGYYLPSQLPVFALGILMYFIIKENYQIKIKSFPILLTSLLLIVNYSGFPYLLPDYFIFGIAFLLLAIALSKYEYKPIVNPVLKYIGQISYSMYLVHFAVLFWLNKYNFLDYIKVSNEYTALFNYALRLIIVIIISVLIASIFYKAVELPMQAVGKRLINRINK